MVTQSQHRARLAKINWPAQIRQAERHGWTIRELADRCGTSYEMAWLQAKRLGYKRPQSPAWHSTAGRKIYEAWRSMRARCSQPTHPSYPLYGGRGVRICADWDKFQPFYDWALRSGYKPGLGLLLKPGSKVYSPRGCRWATRKELQGLALERSPRPPKGLLVEAFGERKSLIEWERDERSSVSAVCLARRLRQGARPEVAITAPPRRRWDDPLPKTRRKVLPAVQPRNLDKERVIRMHKSQGARPAQIALELNITPSYASQILHERLGPEYLRPKMTPARHRLYMLWQTLWARTTKQRNPLYRANGAQGVRVCDEWRSFERFFVWAVGSGTRPKYCLERVRADRGFSPGNCVWVSRSEHQSRSEARKRGGTSRESWRRRG